MPVKGVMNVEAMQTVNLTAKPDDATLRHQFDCVSNLLPLGQPISMWFLTFMRQGGHDGRGYVTLIIMRDLEHKATFALSVPPSAYERYYDL